MKGTDIFDVDKLKKAVTNLLDDYELKEVKETKYNMCRGNGWANGLVF